MWTYCISVSVIKDISKTFVSLKKLRSTSAAYENGKNITQNVYHIKPSIYAAPHSKWLSEGCVMFDFITLTK